MSDHCDLPPTESDAVRKRRRSLRRILSRAAAVLAVLATAGGILLFFDRHRAAPKKAEYSRLLPTDPRLIYEGPYRNIHPDVLYAGDRDCAVCHAEIAASYRRHPMGRSLEPIAAVADREAQDARRHNPFQALGFTFRIEVQGTEILHEAIFTAPTDRSPIRSQLPVHFVIGSGTRGRSYLSNREGYLFQTPISWYGQKQLWDLSPRFRRELLSGRPVSGECLHCHSNRANQREGSLNRYEAPIFTGHAIGCERCHGPGALHSETTHKLDIVHPGRLTPALRDAVCEQCHLEGEERVLHRGRSLYDFRPGLPLSDFWTVFVSAGQADEKRPAVSHVEQMRESLCYQRTHGEDKLTCVSCHDPHVRVAPAERTSYYRQRCMKCHEQIPCRLPKSARLRQHPDDSCIACHMPPSPTADIVHTAATDHRVLSRPRPNKNENLPSLESLPLVPFHADALSKNAREVRRDLGIALTERMHNQKLRPELFSAQALALLEDALQIDPEDVPAWEAKAGVLMLQHRPSEALAAFQNALQRQPEREVCLMASAMLAQNLGQLPECLRYWHDAIEVNPWMPFYRRNLAVVLAHTQQWNEARSQCQAWMRLEPESVEARQLWIRCLLQEGKKKEAQTEFAQIERLRPANLEELRIWFDKQMP